MAGRNIGGFGRFVKNPPKSAKLTSRQNYYFPPSAKLNSRQNYHFSPSAKLNSSQNYYFSPSANFFLIFVNYLSSIYHRVDYRYFEHCAISNKSLKNMKRQRMRDKNSSFFISLLKLVNFNNTFALLLYFFFRNAKKNSCQNLIFA